MNNIGTIGPIEQPAQEQPWQVPQGALVQGQNAQQQQALVNALRQGTPQWAPFINANGQPIGNMTFDQSQGTA